MSVGGVRDNVGLGLEAFREFAGKIGVENASTLKPAELMAQIRQREFRLDAAGEHIQVAIANDSKVPAKELDKKDTQPLVHMLKTACGKDVPAFLLEDSKDDDGAKKTKRQQIAKALNAFMKLPGAQRQALIDKGAMGAFLKETSKETAVGSPGELAGKVLNKTTQNARTIPEYQGKTIKFKDVKAGEISSTVNNVDTALKGLELDATERKRLGLKDGEPVTVDAIVASRVPKGNQKHAKLYLTALLKSMPEEIQAKYLANPKELAKLVDKAARFSTMGKGDEVRAYCTYPEKDPKSINNSFNIPTQLQHTRGVMSGLADLETLMSASPKLSNMDKAAIRNDINKFLEKLGEDDFRRFQGDPLDFAAEALAHMREGNKQLFKKIDIPHVYVTPIHEGANFDGELRKGHTTLAQRIGEYPLKSEAEAKEAEEVNLGREPGVSVELNSWEDQEWDNPNSDELEVGGDNPFESAAVDSDPEDIDSLPETIAEEDNVQIGSDEPDVKNEPVAFTAPQLANLTATSPSLLTATSPSLDLPPTDKPPPAEISRAVPAFNLTPNKEHILQKTVPPTRTPAPSLNDDLNQLEAAVRAALTPPTLANLTAEIPPSLDLQVEPYAELVPPPPAPDPEPPADKPPALDPPTRQPRKFQLRPFKTPTIRSVTVSTPGNEPPKESVDELKKQSEELANMLEKLVAAPPPAPPPPKLPGIAPGGVPPPPSPPADKPLSLQEEIVKIRANLKKVAPPPPPPP
ncbi:MAG: hypothetical protein LBG09_03440, partial [Puniceicoccales bacterium]|nr:hypothetical protein [Puniceicoccales bacterium]